MNRVCLLSKHIVNDPYNPILTFVFKQTTLYIYVLQYLIKITVFKRIQYSLNLKTIIRIQYILKSSHNFIFNLSFLLPKLYNVFTIVDIQTNIRI